MRDLNCHFETFPLPDGTGVVSPQVVQVWNNEVLIVTAIVMINSAANAEFVSCKVSHKIYLTYRETCPELTTLSTVATKLVFQIPGLKKVRDYEIELNSIS